MKRGVDGGRFVARGNGKRGERESEEISRLLLAAREREGERAREIERHARVSAPSPADFEPAGARTRSDYRRRDLKDQRALYIPRADEAGRGWLGNAHEGRISRRTLTVLASSAGVTPRLLLASQNRSIRSAKIGQAN